MKDQEFSREINTGNLCDMLGGEYDPYTNSCKFLKEEEGVKTKSITDDPRYIVFYLAQIFIGTSVSFFTIMFRGSPPRVSAFWYVNLTFLIIASTAFVFSDWFRDNDALETLKRTVLIIATFIVTAILIKTFIDFGTIFNSTYWIPSTYFTGEPIVITIVSMLTASLLNVFIKPWSEVSKEKVSTD